MHTSLGKNLQNIATSCIDISDGLLSDLGHICNQSNKGAEINIEAAKQTANEIILNINIPFHKALL